jgi:hypothetical protein
VGCIDQPGSALLLSDPKCDAGVHFWIAIPSVLHQIARFWTRISFVWVPLAGSTGFRFVNKEFS